MKRKRIFIGLSVCLATILVYFMFIGCSARARALAYLRARERFYPDADIRWSDLDLWIPEGGIAPLIVFSYSSPKYPKECWWSLMHVWGASAGCGGSDHEPQWTKFELMD